MGGKGDGGPGLVGEGVPEAVEVPIEDEVGDEAVVPVVSHRRLPLPLRQLAGGGGQKVIHLASANEGGKNPVRNKSLEGKKS